MPWLSTYLESALERWSDPSRYGWYAFAGRNLRLEDRLAPDRQQEYIEYVGEPRDRDAWVAKHREYDLVHVGAAGAPPRRVLAKRDRHEWPSPFRWVSGPVDLAPDVGLVHLTPAYSLSAAVPGTTVTDLIEAIEDGDDDFLEVILDEWWRTGSRTIFAALREDVASVVTRARDGDDSWADDARDWLGLVHHDPLANPIDVVLLSYSVSDVPRAEGMRERRPTHAPTAIDSGLNPAFCPVAQSGTAGRCVDLAARLEPPVRELLHPRPLLAPRHIVAAGQIKSSVSKLPDARWAHLEWIRDQLGPADFAVNTDADLAA